MKLYSLLKNYSFKPLAFNSAVYINLKKRTFIIIFINNYLIIRPNKHYISTLKAGVSKIYVIKDRGPASYFLKVKIVRNKLNYKLYII